MESGSFNRSNNKSFVISNFIRLTTVIIERNCGRYASVFEIRDCSNLTAILVHENSFLLYTSDEVGKMTIKNCRLLQKIILKDQTFVNYSELNLFGLPQLTDLVIGDLNPAKDSMNFLGVERLSLSKLPMLQRLIIGTMAFDFVRRVYLSRMNKNLVTQ